MDYNTQREKMPFVDYGRNVYKLIQYAKTIESRELRTRAAEVIVGVMSQVNPSARETNNYRRKLWDHLMILSNWELDVDCPFELTHQETVAFHPRRMPYHDKTIRYRHYGRCLESMIRKVSEYPDGEDKDLLSALIVAQMKKSYIAWNRSFDNVVAGNNPNVTFDADDNDIIEHQLAQLSDGRLKPGPVSLDINFRNILAADRPQQGRNRKKKKNKH